MLAWLASLAVQLDLSLEDAVARYADGCPRCGAAPLHLPVAATRRREERFGDLDRVEGGALAEVVAGEEQRQAAAVGDGGVLAEPADVGDVAAGDVERGGHVGQQHAGGVGAAPRRPRSGERGRGSGR